ncbi:isoprenylcysteine carboxylmethyltransferase family protein [Bacillus tianshenii]|nr:isoprenylcysteine carboxylmethyltransferase family protein [Bacillus tianshenii]
MFFYLLFSIVIIQRLLELFIARGNEKWMKANGAIEIGKEHYKWIVFLHIAFFISLLTEVLALERQLSPIWPLFFVLFVSAQYIRFWSLKSLGRFWNTKILVLPNVNVISKGPYKYIRHPNYLIVTMEIFLLPMMFEAYYTALMFSLANGIILKVRITAEEQGLMQHTNYRTKFTHKARFTPQKER